MAATDTATLIQEAQEAFAANRWETAQAYAGAVLAHDPTNLLALVITQAAGLEALFMLYPESGLVRKIVEANRMLRQLDPR